MVNPVGTMFLGEVDMTQGVLQFVSAPLGPFHTDQGALWLEGAYESPEVGISSLKRKVGSVTLVAWARPVMGRLSGSSNPSWTNTLA